MDKNLRSKTEVERALNNKAAIPDRTEGVRAEYDQSATGAGPATGDQQDGKSAVDPGLGFRGEFRVGAITVGVRSDGVLRLGHENTGTFTEVSVPVIAQVLSETAWPKDSELGKLAAKEGTEFSGDEPHAGDGANADGSFRVGTLTLSGGGANPLKLTNSNNAELSTEVDELTLEGALEDAFFTRKIDDNGGEKQGEATKST